MRFNPRYVPALIERKKTHNLAEVCSDLHKIAVSMNHQIDEVVAYNAPQECIRVIIEVANSEAAACLRRHGWSAPVLRGVIRARTSDKWFRYSQINQVL